MTTSKIGKVTTVTVTDAAGLHVFTVSDGEDGYTPQKNVDYFDGADGDDGATFTPSVSSAGVISWSNDGGRQNPASVDLIEAVINALPSAVGVSF